MRINKLFFPSIVIFLVFSSCTIEKRLHNRGYYIEWRKYKVNDNNVNEESNPKGENFVQYTVENNETNTTTDHPLNFEKEEHTDKISSSENKEFTQNTINQKSKYPILPSKKEELNIPSKKKISIKKNNSKYPLYKSDSEYNKLAIISLILAATSLFLFFTVVPAFFVSSFALRQIKANPNRYTNKYAAVIAYSFSLIVIALAIVLLVTLFSVFGSLTLLNIGYIISTFLFFVVLSQLIINV